MLYSMLYWRALKFHLFTSSTVVGSCMRGVFTLFAKLAGTVGLSNNTGAAAVKREKNGELHRSCWIHNQIKEELRW
jgi:hypothetical protein